VKITISYSSLLSTKVYPVFYYLIVGYIIINWYCKLWASVKWKNHYSAPLHVHSGVRHGEILSPTLFNVYLDDMSVHLKSLDLGVMLMVYIYYLGCFVYTDDFILLSASLVDLGKMLNAYKKIGSILGRAY